MVEQHAATSQQMQERMTQLVESWSKGRTSLKDIVGLNEAEMHAMAHQGYLLFMQGKSESARLVFEGLVAIDPRNAYYYRALGAIYWRLNEPGKAVKQFTYALRVSPRDVQSLINRAEVYIALNKHPQARADLQKSLQVAGRFDDALERKARAMLQMIGGT